MEAIAKLIKALDWNWIGVISSNSVHGESASHFLNTFLEQQRICVNFSKSLPLYVDDPSLEEKLNDIIDTINSSTANVVVVFAKVPIVKKLFEKAISRNINRTWIAGDSRIYSKEISNIKNIEKVGTILGFSIKVGAIPGFNEYLEKLQPPEYGTINNFLKEYKELRFGCSDQYKKYIECINSSSTNCGYNDSVLQKSPLACRLDNVSTANDDYLSKNFDCNLAYTTALAVTAAAQALKNIVCKNITCEKDMIVSPRQFLYAYSAVFGNEILGSVRGGLFGNISTSELDIINWKRVNASTQFIIVGNYNINKSTVTINRDLVLWNTQDKEVPFSNCSKSCPKGYSKSSCNHSCCHKCVPCPEGFYTNATDMDECLKCPPKMWSHSQSSGCEERTIEYFQWENPLAIALMALASFGFLLLLITVFLFRKYKDTPAVKAAGGNYSYLMITSLLFSLASICFFIGKPSNTICQIRQPLYGISFTLCVSCILIKSLRIILAFEFANRFKHLPKVAYKPIIIITVLTSLQIIICILWLIYQQPTYTEKYDIPQIVRLQCNEGSYVYFGIMLAYIGFLALNCFILAYKGRKLPEKYNEASRITFSMLIYMFVWIIFIPVYMKTKSRYRSAVQAVAILASVYGVISCHLLSVCYILLFKRKINNRQKYLQSINFSKDWGDKTNTHRLYNTEDSYIQHPYQNGGLSLFCPPPILGAPTRRSARRLPRQTAVGAYSPLQG
ncbi:G- coupled receptor family C group 6 member A-like [Pelobates cultripes]|uniref:G- coupled receptor family C group 6 member A-like n=1 Tax=Pelobates cultripes TaxID=61616 RepID=A0AAD1RHN6_PELCU|nr:G- coupled receptor family C group 6 member A-like [Pelobates cultripes]